MRVCVCVCVCNHDAGIVWDKSGNVLTNYHVLGTSLKALGDKALGARVARVQLLGRGNRSETYDGTLVGLDRARDLAVVKVNVPAEQLQPVTLGTSSQLRVGQQVRHMCVCVCVCVRAYMCVCMCACHTAKHHACLSLQLCMRVGPRAQVLAIGCPFGFDHTLSAGVLHACTHTKLRSCASHTHPHTVSCAASCTQAWCLV